LEARRQSLLASLRDSVEDEPVIAAISEVPREAFVPSDLRDAAYDNRALPIGHGQTISQPLIIAVMTSALKPRKTDRVLEVGTGSGYQAAILSRLVAHVTTVERVTEFVGTAQARLERLDFENVTVERAGEELGWPHGAPYDGILVAAGAPRVPRQLVNQLAENARLVIPVGPASHQSLLVVTRTRTGELTEDLGGCQFVPLIGPEAWDDQAH
jgi:protein-L-isoaspartate(D-aspartate) O-methyltransferase